MRFLKLFSILIGATLKGNNMISLGNRFFPLRVAPFYTGPDLSTWKQALSDGPFLSCFIDTDTIIVLYSYLVTVSAFCMSGSRVKLMEIGTSCGRG